MGGYQEKKKLTARIVTDLSSIKGTEVDVSAKDLNADPRGRNHLTAPKSKTNADSNMPSTDLHTKRDNRLDRLDRSQFCHICVSLTLPVSGSRKRSLKESCDLLS